MTSKNKQSTEQGFSLIEVLIAAAILGGLAVAFTQYLTGAMKGQQFVQNAVDFDIIKTSINMVLNTKACDGAFRDTSGAPVTLNFSAGATTGTNLISSGTPVLIQKILQGTSTIAERDAPVGGGMKLTTLQFSDAIFDGLETRAVGGVSKDYMAVVATLFVGVTKGAGAYGSPGYTKTFSVRLLLDPSGTPATATSATVEKCSNPSSSDERSDCSTNNGGNTGNGGSTLIKNGAVPAFCIENTARAPATHTTAHATCAALGGSWGLCREEEINGACTSRSRISTSDPLLFNMLSGNLWADDGYPGGTNRMLWAGPNAGCYSFQFVLAGNYFPYRCCLR